MKTARSACFSRPLLVLAAILLLLNSAFASGPLERVIYNFQGIGLNTLDGDAPFGGLVVDSAGNLYGTTFSGGDPVCDCGTVFELTLSQGGLWRETVLHNFNEVTDGGNPNTTLILDKAGNLYGSTLNGGGLGTIFELSPPFAVGGNWRINTLAQFGANGSLLLDAAGNLYGGTAFDGTAGAVFELSPPATPGGAWTETNLYSFGAFADDGISPGGLVFGRDGALYGATGQGGTARGGTIFQLVPKQGTWTENILYNFSALGSQDGYFPSDLIFDRAGNLYGTAQVVAFELSPPAVANGTWNYSVLYRFTGGEDGSGPEAKMSMDRAGNLYGTAIIGGLKNKVTSNNGTIFELSPPTVPGGAWTETTLHKFSGTLYNDGSGPMGNLIEIKGKIYGTTCCGGRTGFGTVFSLVIVP